MTANAGYLVFAVTARIGVRLAAAARPLDKIQVTESPELRERTRPHEGVRVSNAADVSRPTDAALGGVTDQQSILTSLAVVRANWDMQSRSYVDTFVPFVVAALGRIRGTAASHTIRDSLLSGFGLKIPSGVVTAILRRADRGGLVLRDRELYTCTDAGRDLSAGFERKRAEADRKMRALIESALKDDRVRRVHESGGAVEALLLTHISKHSVPLLAKIVARPEPISEIETTLGSDGEFAIAAFLSDALSKDPVVTDYIEDVVKGSMLSTAVYLSADESIERRFDKTDLYLDTPLLLKLLGHEGPPAQEAIAELLSASRRAGARVVAFEHSVREARNVLASVESELRAAGRPEVVRGVLAHYVEVGAQPSDVMTAIAQLERDLQRVGVKIQPAPRHKERFTVDEAALEDALREHIRYGGPAAANFDTKSLAAIHQIRAGRDVDQVERTRAVLVTNNTKLANVAAKFFRHNEDQTVGAAIVDHDLATRLWLKAPMDAPDLPRAQVLADSLALLNPTDAVWQRYLDEIDSLKSRGDVTADEVVALRFSIEARRALVSETGNDASRVDSGVVRESLRRTREAAKAEERVAREVAEEEGERARIARDKARLGEAHALKSESDARAKAAELDAALAAQRTSSIDLARQVDVLRISRSNQLDFIHRRAQRFARCVSTIATWLVVAVSLIAVIALQMGDSVPTAFRAAAWVAGLVVTVIGAVSQTVGGSVQEFVRRAEPRLSVKRERRLLRAAGFDPDHRDPGEI